MGRLRWLGEFLHHMKKNPIYKGSVSNLSNQTSCPAQARTELVSFKKKKNIQDSSNNVRGKALILNKKHEKKL